MRQRIVYFFAVLPVPVSSARIGNQYAVESERSFNQKLIEEGVRGDAELSMRTSVPWKGGGTDLNCYDKSGSRVGTRWNGKHCGIDVLVKELNHARWPGCAWFVGLQCAAVGVMVPNHCVCSEGNSAFVGSGRTGFKQVRLSGDMCWNETSGKCEVARDLPMRIHDGLDGRAERDKWLLEASRDQFDYLDKLPDGSYVHDSQEARGWQAAAEISQATNFSFHEAHLLYTSLNRRQQCKKLIPVLRNTLRYELHGMTWDEWRKSLTDPEAIGAVLDAISSLVKMSAGTFKGYNFVDGLQNGREHAQSQIQGAKSILDYFDKKPVSELADIFWNELVRHGCLREWELAEPFTPRMLRKVQRAAPEDKPKLVLDVLDELNKHTG